MEDVFNNQTQGLGEVVRVQGKNKHASNTLLNMVSAGVANVPDQVRNDLLAGKLAPTDQGIYAIVAATQSVAKFFKPEDSIQTGMRNIGQAKLAKGQTLAFDKIRLTAAVIDKGDYPRADTASALMTGSFKPINDDNNIPTVVVTDDTAHTVLFLQEGEIVTGKTPRGVILAPDQNFPFDFLQSGELTVRIGNRTVLERLPVSSFNWHLGQKETPGVLTLDNTLFIPDDTAITAQIDFGVDPGLDGSDQCVALKVELIGSGTTVA